MNKCSKCGSELRHYDMVKRIVRGSFGRVWDIKIERQYCKLCKSVIRCLPKYLISYKHYELYIIKGFISGQLSSFDLEFEDYPCENTIRIWQNSNLD